MSNYVIKKTAKSKFSLGYLKHGKIPLIVFHLVRLIFTDQTNHLEYSRTIGLAKEAFIYGEILEELCLGSSQIS